MLTGLPILTIIICAPIVGILAILLMPKERVSWMRYGALAASLLPLILSFILFISYQPERGGQAFREVYDWLELPLDSGALQLQYHLGLDGLSLCLLVLTALLSVMAVLASFVHIKKRFKAFYSLLLWLETGLLGLLLARDIGLFYLFMEMSLPAMFLLIGIWGGERREQAAGSFLVHHGLGSVLLLSAFVLLWTGGTAEGNLPESGHVLYNGSYESVQSRITGPDTWASPLLGESGEDMVPPSGMSEGMKQLIFTLFIVGFLIRLPVVPLHGWLLRLYQQAPPAVIMLVVGGILQAAGYGLLRFGLFMFPDQAAAGSVIFGILGLLSLLYGGLAAMVQEDFKSVIAYASIGQIGLVLLGIASMNELGLTGALVTMISLGLTSSLLILIVGSITERTGTARLDDLGGLARTMPYTSGILIAAGLAAIGIPGLSGFNGTLLTLLGLFDSMKGVAVALVLGLLPGFVYIPRAVLGVTFGTARESDGSWNDARFIEAVPMIVLLAFVILLGVYPSLLMDQAAASFSHLLSSLNTRIGG
ncbi:NuoM family protein [Paenibacillus sp. GCM10012307]|uniref:NADH-quinone oxidoreductase subunit M n=1 Tax=Paenibacillus roseus TaxID=2798579 RepID=A0A934IZ47_9BACL|nr:NADH-quinone oxidoreductase subunit M [Paenibacillus roseus]MBJ6361892.1 NADH-quinone oxidoreductase subunit M [Paenibacillus roseus]